MKDKQINKRIIKRLRYGIAAFAVMLMMSVVLVSTASAAVINVPGDQTTIQAAINAASSGDTINVAAGTYTEQILIQKSINLLGAGKSTTIIKAPVTRTDTVTQGSTWDYIVAAYPTTGTIDVRIEGFTIDADSQPKTGGTAGLIGVFFRNVSDTDAGLYSNTIQNFSDNLYESWGVRVYGNSDITIDDNTLTDYTRDGIDVNGDDGLAVDPNVVVSNNDLTGRTDTYAPLNGIQIGYGATGTISGNTIRDHTRSSDWAAVGILVISSDGITVSGNTIENCFYGILLTNSDGSIVLGNTLTENIAYHIGLDNSDNNQVSGNIITGTATGIEDKAIGLSNSATGNIIGGPTPADGNTINLLISAYTEHTPLQYVIYIQGSVGSGSNTIQNNVITGGKRAVQIDGGNSETTTISDNTINDSSFAGIYFNGGNSVTSGNTLVNTVRPIEFWGAHDVTISGNTINGSIYDGINAGTASGTVIVSSNDIYNLPGGQFAIHDRNVDDMIIYDNEIYDSHRGISVESGCTGVAITNNYIHDNGWSAMELHEEVTTITGNTLINNWRGIETWSPIIANYNNILSHAYGGVILHNASPHNAEFNWWGDASGPSGSAYPGTGTLINDNGHTIDYSPWLGFAVGTTPMTWHTNDNIRDAIDEASDGDTIIVAAGTYTNDLEEPSLSIPERYRITKSITLLGAQAGNDPSGSTDRGGESILVKTNGLPYSITAPNVIVDGFMNGDSTPNSGGRFIIGDDADNVTIKNNIIQNTAVDSHGVYIYSGAEHATISYNTFYNTPWEAIASGGASDAVISHNYISQSGQHAIQWMNHAGSNNEITYNHISDITDKNAIQYWGGPGAIISYNVIDGGNTMNDGIWLDNAADDSTVSYNQIFNTIYAGINIRHSCTGVSVTHNNISGCGTGIEKHAGDVTGTIINWNCISGNSLGVANYDTTTINAVNNWWGDVSGPSGVGSGTGDAVSSVVDYDPWLTELVYSGTTTFANTYDVILQATLNNSDNGASGGEVDFYIDSVYNNSDTTDSNGIAELNVGTMPVGVYEVRAVSGCLDATALIAVYDPSAGFVTGGGWIDSPVGAYYPDTSLAGKANFGFVSKYKKGAATPIGTTQFKFKVADFDFHSESYDWLVIAGARAQYKGTGTINSEGNYGFMLTAIDEVLTPSTDVDLFRIKIWDKDSGNVVYDNKPGESDTGDATTELGGGSIMIHKAK